MDKKEVFVFGSNERGIHGKGAANYAAKYYGAKYGQGIGRTGDSYAIPTKDYYIRTLPLEKIMQYAENFKVYARSNPNLEFKVTRIGCGLAGYTDEEIAPMFVNCPTNCKFDLLWKKYLGDGFVYWGSQ